MTTTYHHKALAMLCLGALSTLSVLSSSASATPLLRCEVKYADQIHHIEVKPTEDIYQVVPLDIDGRFTFKAIMVAKQDQIDYIKLYVNFQQRRKDVPVHIATYLPPFHLSKQPSRLTPLNNIYAGELERGLQYQCSLLRIAP